jgi:hypothetical protein
MNKSQRRAEKGQAIVLLVFALVGLLAFTGLAIDGGMLFSDRRSAQNAADTAALTGGYSLAANNYAGVVDNAIKEAQGNGFGNFSAATSDHLHQATFDDGKTFVGAYWPPIDGPYQGNMRYVQVKITHTVNTSFIQLVWPGAAKSSVQATVKVDPSGPASQGKSLEGLCPDCCQTVVFNGTGDCPTDSSAPCDPSNPQDTVLVIIYGDANGSGGVFSNSNANSTNCQSGVQEGSGGVIVDPGSIESVGSFEQKGNSGTVSPQPITGVTSITFPEIPIPDCSSYSTVSSVPSDLVTTINPGKYGQIRRTASNSVLTLNPGVYCIENDFVINGGEIKVGGNSNQGVFIYMMNESGNDVFSVGGGVTVDLHSWTDTTNPLEFPALDPTSGAPMGNYNYNGLLLLYNPNTPPTTSVQVSISGNPLVTTSPNTYTGSILAPTVACSVTGTSDVETLNAEIVCYTVQVSGNALLQMYYDAGKFFQVFARLSLVK